MLDSYQLLTLGITGPVALAAIAVLGYLFGRSQRAAAAMEVDRQRDQTEKVIRELETISEQIRRTLATHHGNVQRFRERIRQLGSIRPSEVETTDLCHEAERILEPTTELSEDLAHAYDEIRQKVRSLHSLGA